MRHLFKLRNLLGMAMLLASQSICHATDLLEVYQQALISDPVYQQAVSQRLSTKEGVPISISSILPNISLTANPSITRTGTSGTNYQTIIDSDTFLPRNTTTRAYNLTLTANQTIFNFQQFATIAGSVALSKAADATLNAALQGLMTRVASAYFAVLQDEENLHYSEASKEAYGEQLDQVKQQYNVGVKTITDVYMSQARSDSSVSNYIAAQTTLANDRENLRVITGKYYPHLLTLSASFPLISPQPANEETWVKVAQRQNWAVKSAQYNVQNNLQTVRQQFAGHLPTVTLQGIAQRQYADNIDNYNNTFVDRNGPGTQTNKTVMLNMSLPLFEGGGVVAQTNQAVYNYQVAQQQAEQTLRNTLNTTRQSFLNVLAGISKIRADKEAIKSNISSLEGMQASYEVGTETLVNVLNQRQILFQAQTQYATDRYAFVNNVLALKQAAGTLSFNDLRAINAWLVESRPYTPPKSLRHSLRTHHVTHIEHKPTNTSLLQTHAPLPVKKVVATKKIDAHAIRLALHQRAHSKHHSSHQLAAKKHKKMATHHRHLKHNPV